MSYYTVNYLFASYLQTKEGGEHKIVKVDKVRPGKAQFYFDLTKEEAEKVKLKFHNSCCSEFEQIRKQTIDLCY